MALSGDGTVKHLIDVLASGLSDLPKIMPYVSHREGAAGLLWELAQLHYRIQLECLRILSEHEGKPEPQERGKLERLQDGGNGGGHEG